MLMTDRLLAALVLLVHGVVDNFVTLYCFSLVEDSTIESNPFLRGLMLDGYAAASATGADSILPFLLPAAGLKFLATAFAVVLLWLGRSSIPYWRVFAGFLSVAGFVIVLNNLHAFL